MQSAESLWQEFLAYCGAQEPDDWMAVDFVLRAGRRSAGTDPGWHSQRELKILQALVTWRARNTRRDEPAPVCMAPDAAEPE